MALEKGGLCEEPCLAGAAAADYQDVLVPGVLRLLRPARHRDPLRLRHGDVLEKVLVHEGGDIRRRPPACGPVFHPVPVLLRVLPLHVDRQPQDHRAGNPYGEVRRVEARRDI